MQDTSISLCTYTPFMLGNVFCVLRLLPASLLHPANADTLQIYLKLARLFMYYGLDIPTDLVLKLKRLSSRTPVFVINLARRVDSWNTMLELCDAHRMAAIRVDAINETSTAVSHINDSEISTSWQSTLDMSVITI